MVKLISYISSTALSIATSTDPHILLLLMHILVRKSTVIPLTIHGDSPPVPVQCCY